VADVTRCITTRCAATLICLAVLATGCSGSSSAALCDDAASLRASVAALQHVDIVKNGVSSLQSALDQVKADASKTADAARTEFKPQVDALESALAALGDSLQHVAANGTAPVQQAAQKVESASTDLQDAIRSQDCS
jgi:hypothetical protein